MFGSGKLTSLCQGKMVKNLVFLDVSMFVEVCLLFLGGWHTSAVSFPPGGIIFA